MKIFHTVASLDLVSGGPARSVPQLALALVERECEVGLWAPKKLVGPLAEITAEEGEGLKIFSGSFSTILTTSTTSTILSGSLGSSI